MKALWLEDRALRFRDDLPMPQAAPNEALIRVLTAGICNTDLEMVRGYYPFTGVLGHEFVGVVEEGIQDLIGRRVVGEINITCTVCEPCLRGHGTHCEKRTVLGIRGRDGVFAEYVTLPTSNLHPVPDTISIEAATFVEPLAAALEIQQQVAIGAEDRVLVVGHGKLGQLIAQTLALTGCSLTIVGRRRQVLTIPGVGDVSVIVAHDLSDRSFNVAVECTGNPEGFEIARRALRPRGTLVMKSTYAGLLEIDAAALVVDELTILGSRCGPFPAALDLLADNRVQVDSLIDGRYPLEEGPSAMEHARQPGTGKVLLEIGN